MDHSNYHTPEISLKVTAIVYLCLSVIFCTMIYRFHMRKRNQMKHGQNKKFMNTDITIYTNTKITNIISYFKESYQNILKVGWCRRWWNMSHMSRHKSDNERSRSLKFLKMSSSDQTKIHNQDLFRASTSGISQIVEGKLNGSFIRKEMLELATSQEEIKEVELPIDDSKVHLLDTNVITMMSEQQEDYKPQIINDIKLKSKKRKSRKKIPVKHTSKYEKKMLDSFELIQSNQAKSNFEDRVSLEPSKIVEQDIFQGKKASTSEVLQIIERKPDGSFVYEEMLESIKSQTEIKKVESLIGDSKLYPYTVSSESLQKNQVKSKFEDKKSLELSKINEEDFFPIEIAFMSDLSQILEYECNENSVCDEIMEPFTTQVDTKKREQIESKIINIVNIHDKPMPFEDIRFKNKKKKNQNQDKTKFEIKNYETIRSQIMAYESNENFVYDERMEPSFTQVDIKKREQKDFETINNVNTYDKSMRFEGIRFKNKKKKNHVQAKEKFQIRNHATIILENNINLSNTVCLDISSETSFDSGYQDAISLPIYDHNFYYLEPKLIEGFSNYINIIKVIATDLFYVHNLSDSDYENLATLNCAMNDTYKNREEVLIDLRTLTYGSIVAASNEGNWYRGKIIKIHSNYESADIFFVDYGRTKTVEKSNLKLIEKRFLELDAQAIQCSLANIVPIHGKWSSESLKMLIMLTNHKMLFAQVVYKTENIDFINLVALDRFKFFSVNAAMIQSGFAVYCNPEKIILRTRN